MEKSFLPISKDPLTIILSYLDSESLGKLSQVDKKSQKNIMDYRILADKFILELISKNQIKDKDDFIFKVGMKEIALPENLNRNQLLKYYLQDKKFSNDKSTNRFIKNLIETGKSKEDILTRVYLDYGQTHVNQYIQGFDSDDVKNVLSKYLVHLRRTYPNSFK